ncbi:glycosyltransferase family 39 protein, partial [bacterium]|nr:glycosyltransferase family 39 protein [bacterium]
MGYKFFKKIVSDKLFIPIILIVLAFIVYAPTLNDYFLSDDFEIIQTAHNSGLNFLIIKSDFVRPITNLSFVIDNNLWGDNPFGYHLFSVFCFGLTAILIFSISKLLFKNEIIGIFASLFFVFWPAHHESVTWIAGRCDLICALFYLLAIYLFLLYLRKNKIFHYLLLLLAFALSIFSKEMGLSLIFVLLIVDIFYGNL